jgi:hypothetical protein
VEQPANAAIRLCALMAWVSFSATSAMTPMVSRLTCGMSTATNSTPAFSSPAGSARCVQAVELGNQQHGTMHLPLWHHAKWPLEHVKTLILLQILEAKGYGCSLNDLVQIEGGRVSHAKQEQP